MKVTLPGNVISIEVAREGRRMRHALGNCPHTNLRIHHIDGLICKDCNRQLDALGWLIEHLDEYNASLLHERNIEEAHKKLASKTRVKCIHCQQMTPVRL